MILNQPQIDELRQWAREQAPLTMAPHFEGARSARSRVRLEISAAHSWNPMTSTFNGEHAVARVYLIGAYGYGRTIYPWEVIAERRLD